MEGTVSADDAPLLREELRRARRLVGGRRGTVSVVAAPGRSSAPTRAVKIARKELRAHLSHERALASAMRAPDAVARLTRVLSQPASPGQRPRRLSVAERDGERTTALLVATLRFQRLVRWSLRSRRWFLTDTPAFVAAFRRYHRAVPMTAHFPRQEARLFRDWLARR
jgi:hypothetical protein